MSRQQIVLAAMFAAIAAAPPVLAPPALAQATATAQRETSVEADQMEFIDAEKKAVFTGNVDARRGDVKLTSETLTVFYRQRAKGASEGAASGATTSGATTSGATTSGDSATAAEGAPAAPEGATGNLSGAEVTLLDAKGNVVIITPRERITGDWAKIDVPKDMLTVGGNVVLTQGTSVLRGQKLDVNLKTNRTVMTGGRVKGQFVPQ
jgi:lipopolysaccharide export system protein LptA